MSLKDTLQTDLTTAMKARDELRSATLRMVLTAVRGEEVAGKSARTLGDEEVVAVLQREAKKRREAADAYEAAGRAEQAERERAELGVVETYLPTPLTDEELGELVDEAVLIASGEGLTGMGAMGAVMSRLKPQVAGRADGKRLSTAVRARLNA
ncbi:GatB/YqeY domain-containing protein [Paenibacillus sp. TRM 82003]|uniref:GatB/YqeY domain-containing protein n=1 Tax=Kineococcus sp. TRM81007 TaxID=2925831 RepID=UPI001F56B13C|nr:GatB/YqeY domain-containing protein [Kineococcus sp. TRM81007]MCI2239541.1 GatB/YqeY domain-containing protein [Kineococcus sp. TRM81007]MCI3926177.1 GatB/YqeY domain-containing protein [Paenibacillus sp. TRM 82003]